MAINLPRLRHDPERYERAAARADALRAIISLFGEQKVFIRSTQPITPLIRREMPNGPGIPASNRDRAVCGLVNKACNTHAAVRLLTDVGHGDDAMALGRVLLENATILQWLLMDPVYRLDLYCLSDALFRRRWGELIEQHFESTPALIAAAHQVMDAEVRDVAAFFGNTIHKWAQVLHPDGKIQHVNFERLMKDVAAAGGSADPFQHDVVYFLHSAFVHSTANSMRSFRRLERERYFRFDLGANDQRRDEALGGANIFLFQVLKSAAQYLTCEDIDARLDAWFEELKAEAISDQHNSP